MRNTAIEYTSQLIEMMNESIDSYIMNMESIAQIVVEDSVFSPSLISLLSVTTQGNSSLTIF